MSTNPYLANQLRNLIYYHLDNNLIKNALFLATRLLACEPQYVDGSYLLALCYLRLGQYKAAHEHSQTSGSRGIHLGCAYVYAQACLELGYLQDGITALDRSRNLWGAKNYFNKHTETTRKHLPDAAAVYTLLGKLYVAFDNVDSAVECYVEALKLNPFMWDAFTGLCDTGVDIRVSQIFKMTPELSNLLTAVQPRSASMPIAEEQTGSGPLQSHLKNNNLVANMADPFGIGFGHGDEDNGLMLGETGSTGLYQKLHERIIPPVSSAVAIATDARSIELNTPQATSLNNEQTVNEPHMEPPRAPLRKARSVHAQGMEIGIGAVPRMRPTLLRSRQKPDGEDESRPSTSLLAGGDRKRTISGQVARTRAAELDAPQRRSPRLFSQLRPSSRRAPVISTAKDNKDLKKAKATGTKGRILSGTSVARPAQRNPDEMDIDSKENRDPRTNVNSTKSRALDSAKQEEAMQYLLDLFLQLGTGYFALCHFSCDKALKYFNTTPEAHRETPWALSQIGRAYFEQSKWSEAASYFARIRKMAPTRLEDMDVYSTCLWYLKKDVELAHLAHELMELDRLSPQAWCALGNSFSLRNDHDQGVKCFKRATQLDPQFAYAYTLQGHEQMLNEEFDKAEMAYRNAISADSRHYNAWYGLGEVNERLGKLEMAEKHFRIAARINPGNAILVCRVGMILEKLKNPRGALVLYNTAVDLAPKSTIPRLRKARVLMQLQELDMAHAEFLILKDLAPDEARVHYYLGELYKMFRQKGNAIKHFTTAFQLDPKAGGLIKEAMESLEDDEDDD